MIKGKRGQSMVEYAVLIIVVLAVFLSAGNYLKRGIQGRWKSLTDDLGDQYDPRIACSFVEQHLISDSNTEISTIPSINGYYTARRDYTNSVETKSGSVTIGGY